MQRWNSATKGFFIFASLVIASGCATSQVSSTGVRNGDAPSQNSGSASAESSSNRRGLFNQEWRFKNEFDGPLYVGGIQLENTEFDIPITVNSFVERWVDYFTDRGKSLFEVYLKRAELFKPYIQDILQSSNMPEDLVFLAMIESGFSNHAHSNRKAVGIWQFIPATGRNYGLKINWWVDERRDIEKSTRAAVRYLGFLYQVFGSWELAASAYNAGEAKIAKAIERYHTQDFWSLMRQRYLRDETRNYYPKLIAAAMLTKNKELFGFGKASEPAIEETEGEPSPKEMDIAESSNESDASEETKTAAAPSSEEEEEDDIEKIPTPNVTRQGEAIKAHLVSVDITEPMDLNTIAEAAGITYQELKDYNPELLRWCTPPNVPVYTLKIPKSSYTNFVAKISDPNFERSIKFKTYRVRSGDNLRAIARKFGIGTDGIRDLNSLGTKNALRVGSTIQIPLPQEPGRTLSSLGMLEKAYTTARRGRSRHYRHKQINAKERKAARIQFFPESQASQ